MLKSLEGRLVGYRDILKKKNLNNDFFFVGGAYKVNYEYRGAYWRIRRFSGLCVSVSNKGFLSRVSLVNVIHGIRVEFSFFLYGSTVFKFEYLQVKKFAKIRRSKLFFLRKKRQSLSRI